MLREHVGRAGAKAVGVALARRDRIERGARFQIFEAVSGHAQRPARLVEPLVGAADSPEQARRPLARPHLHPALDVPPLPPYLDAGCPHPLPPPPLRPPLFTLLAVPLFPV